MLEEVIFVSKIEILPESGIIQVQRAHVVRKGGVEIARTYHRVAYEPGADVSREDARVQGHAAVAWTPPVVEAFQAQQEKNAHGRRTETHG